jgi:hypothetical protein
VAGNLIVEWAGANIAAAVVVAPQNTTEGSNWADTSCIDCSKLGYALENSCIKVGDRHFVMSVQIVTKVIVGFSAETTYCSNEEVRQSHRR